MIRRKIYHDVNRDDHDLNTKLPVAFEWFKVMRMQSSIHTFSCSIKIPPRKVGSGIKEGWGLLTRDFLFIAQELTKKGQKFSRGFAADFLKKEVGTNTGGFIEQEKVLLF